LYLRNDVNVIKIPADDIADKLGNSRAANMVVLGALVKKSGVVKLETVFKALEKALTGRNKKLLELNKEALKQGAELVKE
jgi:2-oxoglutarate ferredoxin oxidoreductase subunit gamma